MENQKIVAGLDIGTTKISCFVGIKDKNGKVQILGHGSVPSLGVKRGVVANITSTVESIQQAVALAEKNSGVNIRSVKVGIAGEHIKSYQNTASVIREDRETEISESDINQMISSMYKVAMNPGEDIISVIPQEYTIDGESCIREPIGMMGSRLEGDFHIITGNTSAAKNIYKCVKKAGLEVEELILESLASAHAVLYLDELEAGVALVDIGGGTTDLAIFHENILRHTAVIPMGGEIITEDIKESCGIIKKHAEDLKKRHGSSLAQLNRDDVVISIPGLKGRRPKEISLKTLAQIIQKQMEGIIDAINYEIKSSGYENKLIGGIVITGGGAQLKHVQQLASYITRKDTRIGYPNEHLASETPEEIKQPLFATGIGLVIMGANENNQSTENTVAANERKEAEQEKTAEQTVKERIEPTEPTKKKEEPNPHKDNKVDRWFGKSVINTSAFLRKIENFFQDEEQKE